MKGRQDRQHGDVGADPFRQSDAVLDSLPSEFRPVRWYQDIGIHRAFPRRGISKSMSKIALVGLIFRKTVPAAVN